MYPQSQNKSTPFTLSRFLSFVLISWCENPPSGERVEELRNGYWRPRQFHLSPAIFPFLSPPSLPFSLPRYFLPALVFNFFSSSLTRYIPTPVVSLVTFSRPFVCHCNSSISSNETKVSFRSDTSSRERMKIPPTLQELVSRPTRFFRSG